MSGISGIVGGVQAPMQSPIQAPEGTPREEANESPAVKAQEQQAPVQSAAHPAPSVPGVGGKVNVLA